MFRTDCLCSFGFMFSSFPCNWHTRSQEEYLSISKCATLVPEVSDEVMSNKLEK